MRTTVNIDDDVLRAARHLAESKGQSLGQALSELARASLTRSEVGAVRNGVTLFPVNAEAAGSTLEEVNVLRDALE
ncbi:MAG: CopG family transcriptional regulator [Trueperaceae bacterium]|nr:CopG family transcriptional regulator [Trueperaceae bacterium]